MLTLLFTWLLTWTLACCASVECSPELCGTGQGELDLGAFTQTPVSPTVVDVSAASSSWKQWFEAQLMTGD